MVCSFRLSFEPQGVELCLNCQPDLDLLQTIRSPADCQSKRHDKHVLLGYSICSLKLVRCVCVLLILLVGTLRVCYETRNQHVLFDLVTDHLKFSD